MHSATLYYHDENGRVHMDRPIARVTVTDDATIEIRMQDDSILYSATLSDLGYSLMWGFYPITKPGAVRGC